MVPINPFFLSACLTFDLLYYIFVTFLSHGICSIDFILALLTFIDGTDRKIKGRPKQQ